MSESLNKPPPLLSRRQVIASAVAGVGLSAGAWAVHRHLSKRSELVRVPNAKAKANADVIASYGFDPMQVLREFDYGTLKTEGGRTVREFQITATNTTIPLNKRVSFVSWNFNGRVPGPTLRAMEGDRIRVIFKNLGGHSHSMHFHGDHSAAVDGVEPVRNGTTETYEFDAQPYGVHPYHCHVEPVTRHIAKGLYGLLIIDPKKGRPAADEIVLTMSGYDLGNNQTNDLYAFNGIPNFYREHPIQIASNQRIRLYVVNMIEFDAPITFHLHATMFKVYRTGSTIEPHEETDVITMGIAERHILEFSYPEPGKYMFHPHQDDIAAKGCMGLFEVVEPV